MSKRIVLGVFEAGGIQTGGTTSWAHERSQNGDYRDIEYWIDMAQMLDDADFDFLFFAGGSFGYASVRGKLSDELVKAGGALFGLDGAYLIPALAPATKKLNFVVTSTTGADHPVHTVRKFSTLDTITKGRIGWNIVTGASQNTMASMLGQSEIVPHDKRYEAAEEYLEVALKFWEKGNEDDVIVLDRENNVFADPRKINKVEHEGTYYRSSGYNTQPPSPQRTPLLFQAGTSNAGRDYAARNAECVFVQGTTVEGTAAAVADIRRRAESYGRDGQSIKMLVGITVIVAPTSEEAWQQRKEFVELNSDEFTANYYAGNTGVDLLEYDMDIPLADQIRFDEQAGQMGLSNIQRFLGGDGRPSLTPRQILDELKGRGTRGFQFTGNPEEVADQIVELMDATDLDGIMLEAVFNLASLRDFIELVQPELQKRGRLAAPQGGTFREQMIGSGSALHSTA